jgi:Glycosyltransferase Family 4
MNEGLRELKTEDDVRERDDDGRAPPPSAVRGHRRDRGAVKICDLALFSQDTSSGVKTYIESKIDYVRSRDQFEHVVIVPGRTNRVSVDGRSKVIVVRGTPAIYPGICIAVNLRRIAALIEQEAPDIIELNCQYTLPWAAFLATRHSRTPIVGIYHTDLPVCAGVVRNIPVRPFEDGHAASCAR